MAKKRQSVPVVDEIKVAKKKSPAELFAKEDKEENSNIIIPDGKIHFRIPTGSIALDNILGGGIPAGRLTQLYGEESVGKTSLLYRIISEAQKMGLSTVLVAQEGSFDEEFARACGIDIDDVNTFHKYAGKFAEATLNRIIEYIRLSNVQLIAIDSIAAVNPLDWEEKALREKEGESGTKVAAQAKVVTEWIAKSVIPMLRNDVAIIAVNQFRSNIGGYGSPVITTGGRCFQYNTVLKLRLNKHDHDKKQPLITKTTVVVEKGKDFHIQPFKVCELEFIHGKGLQREPEIARLAEEYGIVDRVGAWYSYNSHKWQGRDEFVNYLKDDSDLLSDLEQQIRKKIKKEE